MSDAAASTVKVAVSASPTRLLVSVRDVNEAAQALAGGADIIDVKEPHRGSLGAADAATIDAIAHHVGSHDGGLVPVSAACGELHELMAMQRDPGVTPPIGAKLSYVKIGLSHASPTWRDDVAACYAKLGVAKLSDTRTGTTELAPPRAIAVAYADASRAGSPDVLDVLAWAADFGAAGLLIDTFVKDSRGLFSWLDEPTLRQVAHRCAEAGLMLALAGSLKGQSLQRAAALRPDIIAVRGAACISGDRTGRIDANAVRQLRSLLVPPSAITAASNA